MFETTALAIEGNDKGYYYGSVMWGYEIEAATPKDIPAPTTADPLEAANPDPISVLEAGIGEEPVVKKMDIELASKGTPTENFMEAARMWNAGKIRGILQVTADPAIVWKTDVSGRKAGDQVSLEKHKKLKQIDPMTNHSGPVIHAEVLDDNAIGTSEYVQIKPSDVKDMGDGSDTKKLPIQIRSKTDDNALLKMYEFFKAMESPIWFC